VTVLGVDVAAPLVVAGPDSKSPAVIVPLAIAIQTNRLNKPLSPIALPCYLIAPATIGTPLGVTHDD
jgi:hypothetical protein